MALLKYNYFKEMLHCTPSNINYHVADHANHPLPPNFKYFKKDYVMHNVGGERIAVRQSINIFRQPCCCCCYGLFLLW